MKISLLTMMAGFMLMSCKSDEIKVEIVDDPVTETVEYYIAGKVTTADGTALSGVTVDAEGVTATTAEDGTYSLTVASKGKVYTVTFTLDGYMAGQESYEAKLTGSLTNRAIVSLNAIMSKKGETVDVTAKQEEVKENEVLVLTEKGSEAVAKSEGADGSVETAAPVAATIAVAVPKEAIVVEEGEAAPQISVTPYVAPAAAIDETPSTTPKVAAVSLANLKVESVDAEGNVVPVIVQAPVTVQISATSGNTEATVNEAETFETVKVYRKMDESTKAIGDIVNGWKEIGTAIFNAVTKSYSFTIAKGERLDGEFSARVEPTVTISKTMTEVTASDKKSNAGNTNAIDFSFDYQVKTGWDVTSEMTVSETTQNLLLASIASTENSTKGYVTTTKTFEAKISGNYILFYSVNAKYIEKTYSFKLKGSTENVNVTVYKGADLKYENKNADQHSGGSM